MTSTKRRHVWMDVARGVAIVLVMLLHANAIGWMLGAGYPQVLRWIGTAAEPYRMPTLLVLSGVLLVKSLQKKWTRYYAGKIQLILWPFVVWFLIHWVVDRGSGYIGDLGYWLEGGYLWFLIVIGMCYVVGPLVRVVPPWLIAAAMILTSVPVNDPFTERFLYYGAFFFVGAEIGRHLDHFMRIPTYVRVVVVGIALVWAVVAAGYKIAVDHQLYYFVMSCFGVIAVMLVLQKVGLNPVTRLLAWIGRHSMVFYVAHFPVMLVLTYKLMDYQIYNPWILGAVAFFSAFFVATALVQVRHVVPFNWLFQMPTPTRQDWAHLIGVLTNRTPSETLDETNPNRVRTP